jgi:hypothetical protein
MPGPSLELEFRMKDGKVAISMDSLAAKEDKVEGGLAKIARAARKADEELTRFGKRTAELNTTPLERYERQMGRLDLALQRNKITQDTYNRAISRARLELENAGRGQDSLLGGDPLRSLAQITGGYLTLQGAINLVASAFRHARQESEEALTSLRSLDDTRRNLAQLSIGEAPGTLAAWQTRIDKAASASGVDRAAAQAAFFEAKSFGFDDKFEQVLAMDPLIKASAATRLSGKVNRMFGDKLSPREIANMALEAGKPSEANVEQFADAAAAMLEGGLRIGATPEETFAILSEASAFYASRGEGGEGAGSARIAGHRASAFAHKVATRMPELKDKGVLAAFDAISKMSPAEQEDFLKENEEVGGFFEMLTKIRPRLDVSMANISRARAQTGVGDNVGVGLANIEADPRYAASKAVKRAELAKTIAQEDLLGTPEAERQAAANRFREIMFRKQTTGLERFGADMFMSAAAFLGLGGENTVRAGEAGRTAALSLINPLLPHIQISGYFEEVTSLLRDIRDASVRNRGVAAQQRAAAVPQ